MRLKNKVILVTASTRGISLAIVKKCAAEGAQVYMAARNMERAQEIADTLQGIKCVYNDATKPECRWFSLDNYHPPSSGNEEGGLY